MAKIIEEQKGQIKYEIIAFLERYFKWIVAGLIIAILALGYFFLIQPKYQKIIEESKSIGEDKQAEYWERANYLKKLRELKAVYKQINPKDISKIEAVLPAVESKEELLAQLEAIVLKNGLLLTSLQIEEKKEEEIKEKAVLKGGEKGTTDNSVKEIGSLKITMEIIGTDYTGLKNLLGVIENNLRLLDATKISFAPQENKTSLEMFAYFLKNK
ncbi:hypothetical protein HY798_04415 [Candidatus Falkowbacteria bacterium]|nr:hypothetical protein [Candidatus Falkowbacteria bacterium]